MNVVLNVKDYFLQNLANTLDKEPTPENVLHFAFEAIALYKWVAFKKSQGL